MKDPGFLDEVGPYPDPDDPALPEAIRQIQAVDISVNRDRIIIRKIGAFDNMGYRFEPDLNRPGRCNLYYFEMHSPDIRLYTIDLETSEMKGKSESRGF